MVIAPAIAFGAARADVETVIQSVLETTESGSPVAVTGPGEPTPLTSRRSRPRSLAKRAPEANLGEPVMEALGVGHDGHRRRDGERAHCLRRIHVGDFLPFRPGALMEQFGEAVRVQHPRDLVLFLARDEDAR